MELRDYGTALRRYWTTWAAVTLAGLLVALAVLVFTPPTYQATAQVFVASATDSSNSGAQFVNQRVTSYPDVADSRTVLGPVIGELGLQESVRTLQTRVTATNPTGTSQIDIAVTDSDPARAAQVANAVADRFRTSVQDLERSRNGSSPVQLTVTNPATVPLAPVFPRAGMLLPLGLVVGLALGAAIAILRSRRDTRLYTADDVRAAWGDGASQLVVHDTVPRLRRRRRRRSHLIGHPATLLARQLEPMAEHRAIRVVVLPVSPTDERLARSVAEDVAAELGSWGVSVAVSDGLADRAAGDGSRVLLAIGRPTTTLPEWRRLAGAFDGAVVVVPPRRVDRAELPELRSVLTTAGLRVLSVILPPRRRGDRPSGRTAALHAPTSQQLPAATDPRSAHDSAVSTAS